MVRAGKFREDLFYRLNVIPIQIPPLRARPDDIVLIAMHFIERFNKEDGRSIEGLSPDAQEALLRYSWPGNIRELENTIRRTVIMCGDGVITARDLPDKLKFEISDDMLTAAPVLSSSSSFGPSGETLFIPFSQDDVPIRSDSFVDISALTDPSRSGSELARSTDRLGMGDAPPADSPTSAGGPFVLRLEGLEVALPEEGVDLKALVEFLEESLIAQALERAEDNRAAAARLLQMNRTTLVERLKKLDRKRKREEKKRKEREAKGE